ncbi:YopX family protein [Enterococcus gallinarum]|uniref:YopX family protein n=1 Tax=Enterococcus gallinarum TaxID=1353 RepID=UPI003D6BADF5
MIPKFRAWDKNNKEMISWRYLLNGYNLRNVFMRPEMCGLELMQSTGLKDKNDVEIFEGDIVSVRNHPFQKTEKSGAGIEIDGDYAISWKEGDLTWCAGNLLLARLKPYVTVAGNIYENPELLEQADES